MKNRFLPTTLAVFFLLGIGPVKSAEDNMEWEQTHLNITPAEPYLEFKLNVGNDYRYNSYVTEDIVVKVGDSEWKVGIFKTPGDHDLPNHYKNEWKYNNVWRNGKMLQAGYTYNKGDDYWATFRVWFTDIYDGQKLSLSWSTKFSPNWDKAKDQSGSCTCDVSVGSSLALTNPTVSLNTPQQFSTSIKTPSDCPSSYRYTFYSLTEDRDLSEMRGSSDSYAAGKASADGAGKEITLSVTKTPQLYLIKDYYLRYTLEVHTDYGTTAFYGNVNYTVRTDYPLSGSGTSNEPFLIASANDLIIFRDMVNSGLKPDICGKLTADIDMSGIDWRPIGRYTNDNECRISYAGTFDGDGHVISNLTSASTNDHDMGLIGRSGNGCTVKNLIITNVSLKTIFRGAPLVGLAAGTTTVENCGTNGSLQISCIRNDNTRTDGLANGCSASLKSCYTTWPESKAGANNGEYRPAQATCTFYGNNFKNMILGQLCYELNGRTDVKPAWYQTIGVNEYPVLRDAKAIHKTGVIYHNGELPFKGSGIESDPYQLATEEHLKVFKDYANMGFTNICAIMTTDIDYSAFTTADDMIGTEANPYTGTFSGGGKCLKIAFSISEEVAGLFRYVRNAKIGDLYLLGSIKGKRLAGSLIGITDGTTAVSHVVSDMEVISSYTGDAACGGIVAGAKGTLSIDNCAFRGSLLGSSADNCGGFVGWNHPGSQTCIEYSYFAPQKIECGSNGSCTFVRSDSKGTISISECFYTEGYGTLQGEKMTEDQMRSGEACFRLNNSSNNDIEWLQTIGEDSFPTLWGSKRVYRLGDNTYSNFASDLPGAGTPTDPFLIGSAIDLESFRDMVNKGLYSLCGRLTADIDMRDRNWVPIGRWTMDGEVRVGYTGIFDGDGFVIHDLTGKSTVDNDMGLIGWASKGCTVKNLIMENVHLEGLTYSAPIIGHSDAIGTIENCASIGLIKLQSTNFGGILCDNGKVTLSGCYTVAEKLSPSITTSKDNNYCNVNEGNMASSGELCYKLNGGEGTTHHWLQTIGKTPYPLQRTGLKVGYRDGKYYNIDFTDKDNTVYTGEFGSSDLQIIHHGGHLYEFVIVLGRKDGQGEHPYPDMDLAYKENGSWIKIASMKNINREKLPFTGDWSGELSIDKGIFINPHTYETQPPVFWIMQGNHSTQKAASILWLAPSDLEKLPKEFRMQSVNVNPTRQIANYIIDTKAPTGANAVTVVEPYINPLSADKPGVSASMIVSPNMVYSLGLWDATDDCFISTQEITAGANSVNLSLPQQDRVHKLVALMYARQSELNGTNMDTTYVTYGVPFSQKPIHAIRRTNVDTRYNESNTLKWAIAFPKDSDMIKSDVFSLYRSLKSDFSDATSIASFPLDSFKLTTTENDSLMGWFTYSDTSKDGMSTSERYDGTQSAFDSWNLEGEAKTILTAYKYPARYIYYGVERSTVIGMWSNAGSYRASWKVLLTNVLPRVDSIRVIQADDWKTSHKVTLRLVLNNPYPEDLVPESYRNAVAKEAAAHGFKGRMFHWDEKATIVINRFSKDEDWYEGVDEVAKTITVQGSDIKMDSAAGCWYVSVNDIQAAPYTHYYYRAQVDNSASDYPICSNMTEPVTTTEAEAKASYSKTFGEITNFKASRGEDVGRVDLSWEADNPSSSVYTLIKTVYAVAYSDSVKPASAADSLRTVQTSLSTNGNTATDGTSNAGLVNQYTLTNTWTFRGKPYTSTAVAYGWSLYNRGSISGHVYMPNGSVMPGDVYVTIRLKSPSNLHLRKIYTPDGKEVILPAFRRDSVTIEVKANEEGYYNVDSLCYFGSGMQYEVSARCNGATFTSSTGTSSAITLTLEDANYRYTNVDFVCRDTKQFSGRVLFEGSTVPVRDMPFYVNGRQLKDINGNSIMTDAMGNFSFAVPRFQVQIQARKDGHTLKGDGFILGGPGKDQKTFTPTEDYEDLLLYDSTTVRLTGRIVGGDSQSSIPIGFGESKNNLGDSITLVLQLEGDNTSYLYYNAQDPDQTEWKTSTQQKIDVSPTSSLYRNKTGVSYERKRIVVRADNATGEFCVDLYPTKYKVSQIYANGYSTLYRDGEGIKILDLSDSKNETHVHINGQAGTDYAAAFNLVYHTPAKLTLTQQNAGQSVAYAGESAVKVTTLTGDNTIQTAWTDTTGQAKYTFGYPVFNGGTEYTFLAKAVEEYHYNNIPAGQLSTAPVSNAELSVFNGMSSSNQTITKILNNNGETNFSIKPSNTTFSFTGENALFTLYAAAKVNGYSSESEAIKGYVTGTRDMGEGVQAALKSKPEKLDIIRDPYGSGSYAYREKGTTYTWSRHYENDTQEYFYFNISLGLSFLSDIGFMYMQGTQIDIPLVQFGLNSVRKHNITYKDGEYTLTLSDRISTSSDPLDVGAMADIYIGKVSTVDIRKTQVFSLMDKASYTAAAEAVKSGALKVVKEGRDANGKETYLVIGQGVAPTEGADRVFVYSQKYIIGTLIPELEKQRDIVKRIAPSSAEAQQAADRTGCMYYYYQSDTLAPAWPSTLKDVATDSLAEYNKELQNWKDLVMYNEKEKIDQMSKTASNSYSFSQATIEHSESASTYYREVNVNGPTYTVISGGTGAGNSFDSSNASNDVPGSNSTDCKGFGLLVDLGLGGGNDKSITNTFSNYTVAIGGSGYSLSTPDNGVIDMDVYQNADTNLVTVNSSFKSAINNYESGKGVDDYKKTNGGDNSMTDDNSCIHNYIFVQRGGSTRNPWSDADSTFYYQPNGKREPLGARTLRIDNPKIYVENPVVNNQPQDEPAVFTIRLANETEINENTKYLNPSTLYLNVDEASNPDGAKLTIDGQPLRNHMEFYLNPGQSAVKTLEVERGGKPYDYENIKLQFTDNPDFWTLCDEAAISVHYLPNSSPVNLSLPADNWLINTLSQKDDDGKYYIPVQIDGFSTTNYDNFDHIELQYKKQTESEDQWVNLCSYYASTDEGRQLYAKATGPKDYIYTEGKIDNIRFYGEKDPVEMKYDLRAVSFCRLGTGYVTRYSKVVSGTKDTRCPEVFGKPTPADGILDFDDVISLPFTEAVAYNYLDKTANFSVQGYTNNSDADHSTYLRFPGSEFQEAATKLTRSTVYHDFTIEMMVKVENASSQNDIAGFFSLCKLPQNTVPSDNGVHFGYRPADNCLVAIIGGKTYESVKLSSRGLNIMDVLTHVAMSYSAADSTIEFVVGEEYVPLSDKASNKEKCVCKSEGKVYIGTYLKGKMADIRVWSRKMSASELAAKYNKSLSTSEKWLYSYWPMREAQGNVVYDIVSGADFYLTDVTWQTPDGYSLRIEKAPVRLTEKAMKKFTRDNTEDYTLTFWFRCDADSSLLNTMLFSAGSDGLSETGMDKMRIGFANGNLVFRSEGNTVSLGATSTSLTPSVWHHVAVSVNHSQNVASFFLDGTMVNEYEAEKIGGIAGSYVAFGDNRFSGNIDNITLWSMALPASYIHTNYNTDLTGRELELLVNLDFEQQLLNEQGSFYTGFSPMNNVIVHSTGKIAGDTLVAGDIHPDADIYAPIRAGEGLQNIPFTWSSTDNALQINLKKADAYINHQQLNLVVRNVEDVNGNPMKNACMWSVYVNRNILEWDTPTQTIDVSYGSSTSTNVSWQNKSGRVITYFIENEATWLQIDNTMGTMQPISTASATLTVNDGLSPGKYTTRLYLVDEDYLVSTMTLQINVVAEAPDWRTVDEKDYQSTMNVMAQVKKKNATGNWITDMSKLDIVAAFIGELCVGKSYLTVDETANTSYLFMTISGNSALKDKELSFRLWDSSTGQISVLETGTTDTEGIFTLQKICYSNNAVIGADKTLEMRTTTSKMQRLSLASGWNWVSFNVRPTIDHGLEDLFSDCSGFDKGDVITRPGCGFSLYQGNGKWDSQLDDMDITASNVYQIYKQQEGTVSVSGIDFDENGRYVTLSYKTNKRWAELAYLLDVTQPVGIALSDLPACSDKAPAGTVVKSRKTFAVARDDGHWFGSLDYLRPGEGYFVLRNGTDETTFNVRYINNNVRADGTKASLGLDDSGFNLEASRLDLEASGLDLEASGAGLTSGFEAIAAHAADCEAVSSEFMESMPVIAAFAQGTWQEGDILVALVNGDVAGASEALVDERNGQPYFFLSVNASDKSVIRFVKVRDGQVIGESRNSLNFNGSAVIGTLASPYLIDFTESVSEGVYDATGIKYPNENYLNNRRGVYIINGQKIVK